MSSAVTPASRLLPLLHRVGSRKRLPKFWDEYDREAPAIFCRGILRSLTRQRLISPVGRLTVNGQRGMKTHRSLANTLDLGRDCCTASETTIEGVSAGNSVASKTISPVWLRYSITQTPRFQSIVNKHLDFI